MMLSGNSLYDGWTNSRFPIFFLEVLSWARWCHIITLSRSLVCRLRTTVNQKFNHSGYIVPQLHVNWYNVCAACGMVGGENCQDGRPLYLSIRLPLPFNFKFCNYNNGTRLPWNQLNHSFELFDSKLKHYFHC